MSTKTTSKKLISSLEQIPSFESDEAEVEFWESHSFSPELLLSLPDAPEVDRIHGVELIPEPEKRKK